MGQNLTTNFVYKDVLIDQSEDDNLSEAVACLGLILIGIHMPAAWTAANITFQGSTDGGTNFFPLRDEDNTVITWTGVDKDQIHFALPASPVIGGLTHLKIGTSVGQAADRTLKLIFAVPNP